MANPIPEKKIIIIAGPNGAGKTTFAEEFLPKDADCPNFVNADLIAAGLSPFAPEQAAIKAGRLMLQEIHEYARKGVSFSFETALAGKGYARLIPEWRKSGYSVKLFFLSLPTPELAIERVRIRVALDGHSVPEPVVRRRFSAGLKNFEEIYKPIVDAWVLYDNSANYPKMLSEGGNDG
ncbi:Predicted ABC-type ATPase [Desulfatibacillum alkenivorans DSM 16219]|uniref:Predicted ABC-type ATPase n=1 Tax=Desulfatibacillum alkenivorans DSM 16219 TaxID=1121393 RepID=A0A1M6KHX5_9BACT|nr:zeta toxin family protein [Desulfatibacillum alkenivorans]SHJ58546.1 Predicted ABC-type ATPase [Desulfatibacillum alkenivorans DSM 16219]